MKTKVITISLITTVIFLLIAAASWAQEPFSHRRARQLDRIDQGVKSRQLTRSEARRLANEQLRIQRESTRARADGRISPSERDRLERMQNRSGRHIYALKHNRRQRDYDRRHGVRPSPYLWRHHMNLHRYGAPCAPHWYPERTFFSGTLVQPGFSLSIGVHD